MTKLKGDSIQWGSDVGMRSQERAAERDIGIRRQERAVQCDVWMRSQVLRKGQRSLRGAI